MAFRSEVLPAGRRGWLEGGTLPAPEVSTAVTGTGMSSVGGASAGDASFSAGNAGGSGGEASTCRTGKVPGAAVSAVSAGAKAPAGVSPSDAVR
ncbi:hypothetical protein [Arthrobacter sp. SLBN-112]|uniref:hypothetical protein n=1 Tax=Arthrobacter sp. SLBN-112 TaxID=2768452 RepID=UPI00114F151B|nr:hypothetical protein [Arthrobacter sp. SLBN-112]